MSTRTATPKELSLRRPTYVAVPARLIIPARHPLCIEATAMRADSPPERRVALHAVTLRVATGAALEALARRLTMLQEPEWLTRVERGVAAARGSSAVGLMTVLAEHLGVVTARAVALTTVSLRRVPHEEVRWVEASRAFAGMAVAAKFPRVAALAGELTARRCGTMRREESGRVHAHRYLA